MFAATPTTAPSSGHSNYELTFPCLNLKKMSKEEKQQLHQRLYAESVEMIKRFQDLFSDTTQSLKQRKVSVKELLCNLVGLGPLPPAYDDLNLPVFRRHLPQLTKSKTIEEAMFEIGHYCSFFNFHMIEHIINKLGTRQDRKNLEKYREEFDKYAERHVFECPAEVGTVSEGLANMFVTLDKTFDTELHSQHFRSVCGESSQDSKNFNWCSFQAYSHHSRQPETDLSTSLFPPPRHLSSLQ